MLLDDIRALRENVNFEAKSAVGGLPKSLWETYSAFANTDGGVILLGAKERKNHALDVVGVGDVEGALKQFWDVINNRAKVSLNLLSDKDVSVEELDGKKVIRINVPRAGRCERPIYLNRDVMGATFRRNGEGDYRCSESEVRAMLRDADQKSQDTKVVAWATVKDLNLETVHRYRNRMQACRPGHVWLDLDDAAFLRRLGALAFDEAGELRATCAGLLMFGNEYDIVREFPKYILDYQEWLGDYERWSDRVVSMSGEWSGNVYDFYFRVYNKLAQTLKVPFRLEGQDRIDDTPVHKAIREVLVNCLVNAEYTLAQGVVIERRKGELTLSNPGLFRVPIEAARAGGVSDPRNETILKMFTLIDIGERAGGGIPSIEHTWEKCRWQKMVISEKSEPARVKVTLQLPSGDLANEPIKGGNEPINGCDEPIKGGNEPINGQKNGAEGQMGEPINEPINDTAEKVFDYIVAHPGAKRDDIVSGVGMSLATVKRAIEALMAESAARIEYRGSNKTGGYYVK